MADIKIDNKEFDTAVEEAQNADSLFTYTLKKPVTYNGNTIETLSFDFDKLTGEDAIKIEDELNRLGTPVISPTFSGEYLIRMSARACTTPVGADLFKSMSLFDYNKIRSKARSFLLSSEL